MARREAILPEELFETANRLKAEGKKVSADSLMEALGGGSYRTIYRLMGQWEQMQPTAITTSPNEIPAAVQASFASAWRLAAQEAERGLLAAKEKAAEEVSAALQQVEGALEQIGKLEAESEADAIRIEELTAKLAEKEELVHMAQTDAAGHRAAAEQLQKLVEKAEETSKVDRAARETALKEAAELKGEVNSLLRQNEQLVAKLAGTDKEEKKKS
jgi:chromosome segregation ATPase